jgi:hypothetical protein
MKTFYIVSYQNRREPECYIGGLYDEKQLADARCKVLGEDYDYAWFDEVQLGDLDLCNR